MSVKYVGRPIKENAITRLGKLLRIWVTAEEVKFLDNEAKSLGVSRTLMIRLLVQKAMKERS